MDLLPGIGPVYAGRIVACRNVNGLFTNEIVEKYQGIGTKTM